MNFLAYVKDKRYFLCLYAAMMLFISLMILLNVDLHAAAGNLAYINGVCLLMAGLYIVIGYFYRKPFYHELKELAGSDQEQFLAAAPLPQNEEQQLYLNLMRKVYHEHGSALRALQQEIREHQEYIMSWIHEVKLPISASYLIMEDSADKNTDDLIDKLEDEMGKIEHLVEQALYYSRIDSFSRDYFITEMQLEDVIKRSVKKYVKLFINKQIQCHMSDVRQAVHSDVKWLTFILDQIVSNALKYTGEGGGITFSFEEDQAEKRLHIQDTGVGIPPEDLHRVFDKGFTGTIGRNHAKSTGMGLYLAKQLALKLGHHLSIESQEGRYTKVTIHFPKAGNYMFDHD